MISLSTPLSYVAACGLFFWAISTSGAGFDIFMSPQSLAIVLGGTVFATIISYDFKTFLRAIGSIIESFKGNNYSKKELSDAASYFVNISQDVNRKQMTNLYSQAPKCLRKDPLFEQGMHLLTSKYTPQHIKSVLSNMNDASWQDYTAKSVVLNKMASYAPGFGVMGTIIGLMGMMQNMSGDMAAMGASLAVAFVTTFYGIFLAQIVFKPSAGAVVASQEGNHYRGQILTQAFVALAERTAQDEIGHRLEALANPKKLPEIES